MLRAPARLTRKTTGIMTSYAPPIADLQFNLRHFFHHPDATNLSHDEVDAILNECGRFAAESIAPLNRVGDTFGARLENEDVRTAPGWKDAYATYASGGWLAASIAADAGGMGLPNVVGASLQEMIQSSSMAFALCPMLSQAAIKAILLCGSDVQKQTYLPHLLSGKWTGTMVLTEPAAGSDLANVRTRAEKNGDFYNLKGQKIFITYGDHDLTENIVHLVLARTSGAQTGTKGLSLFIALKRRVRPDGSVGDLNDIKCVSLEHKLGIHGSPTACLSFGERDDCQAELVGEEGRGLEYMFVMMNEARLSVGIQGVAVAERAYQAAVSYAADRKQGRIVGASDGQPRPIQFHPDVHRMLMTMRANCEAMRGVALYASHCMDRSEQLRDPNDRKAAHARLDLLVPIVKAWCTETACDVTSMALQVYGGMGYVEETGVAQHFRDARITTIYEGTTGIQANDLTGRKIRRDRGQAAKLLLKDLADIVPLLEQRADARFATIHRELALAIAGCEAAVDHVVNHCDDRLAAAVSVPVLHLFGLTLGAWHLARSAFVTVCDVDADASPNAFREGKIATAHYFAAQILPRSGSLLTVVTDRSGAPLSLYPGFE